MEQEAEGGPEASSKNALANFFKEKYDFLIGSESSEIKLNTAEIQAIAKFVDSLIKVAASEGNATRDLLISLQKLVDSSSGKGLADPAAAQGEKETLTV